jgi:hypothetical protein
MLEASTAAPNTGYTLPTRQEGCGALVYGDVLTTTLLPPALEPDGGDEETAETGATAFTSRPEGEGPDASTRDKDSESEKTGGVSHAYSAEEAAKASWNDTPFEEQRSEVEDPEPDTQTMEPPNKEQTRGYTTRGRNGET